MKIQFDKLNHNVPSSEIRRVLKSIKALSADDLMDFWYNCTKMTRADAADLLGGRWRGYISVLERLGSIASNLATAKSCAQRKDSHGAEMYNGIAAGLEASLL